MCGQVFPIYCPVAGRVITGTSLMLNIFLALLKGSNPKVKIPSAFPVIGVMGNVYHKLLQLAASALTIDQTVTTILQSIDNNTIQSTGAMTQGTVQREASGIFASLGGTVIVILLVALAILALANIDVCCYSNCYKYSKVTRCEIFGQCLCGTCVVFFVITFIVGDINWIWEFFHTHDADIGRWVTLSLSLALLLILSGVHILVIFFPGVGTVLSEDEMFLPKYASSDNGMMLNGLMVRRQYNDWDVQMKEPTVIYCK